MINQIGLRETKKQHTKQALFDSAYKLFKKQGYSKTSIEDIARDANFAPRTFFLHFDSKEDLLFPEKLMIVDSLRKYLAERDPDTSALQILRFWIKDMTFKKESGNSPNNILRRKIIDSDKALQARQRLDLIIIEDILTDAIANDLKVSNALIEPRIVAAAAIAIFGMIDEKSDHNLKAKQTQELVDTVFKFLESGLKGLAFK